MISISLCFFLKLFSTDKMLKRIVAILLCCCIVSNAETVQIGSAPQLIEWFNTHSDTSQVTIELTADLDFKKTGLNYPLGVSQGSCHAFSGSFKGREHKIKGLVMNNKNDNTYSSAGLFCELKGAIIDDLVIDKSCKFTGVSAGALSVKITGSGTVNILNVENNAEVNGEHSVGGLIGYVDNKVNEKVILERCRNTGTVTTSGNDAGGLIGHVENSQSTQVIIQNSYNTGVIKGAQVAGGFVGFFRNNDAVTIFVNKSINENTVEGNDHAGGFLGYVERATEGNVLTVDMGNNINRGNVKGTNMACGFFCSVDSQSDAPNSDVSNNINHGEISGSDAYGFAPIVTEGVNDVNLGKVSGTHYSASFWKQAKGINTIVTMEEICQNCDGAVWAVKNADGTYNVTKTRMQIHDLLNWNIVRDLNWLSYSFWNSKLELQGMEGNLNFAHSLAVSFTAIAIVFLVMIQGFFSH